MRVKTVRPGVERDLNSRALLTTDQDALKAYKRQKAEKARISKLEEDVAEIKAMLRELVGKMNGPR